MDKAASIYASYFKKVGVDIKTDNQPFSNFVDYYNSGGSDEFGIIAIEDRFAINPRKGFKTFRIEDVTIINDYFIVYDETRLNEQAISYIQTIKKILHCN